MQSSSSKSAQQKRPELNNLGRALRGRLRASSLLWCRACMLLVRRRSGSRMRTGTLPGPQHGGDAETYEKELLKIVYKEQDANHDPRNHRSLSLHPSFPTFALSPFANATCPTSCPLMSRGYER